MTEFLTTKMIEETVNALRVHTSVRPRVGLILGSGLGHLADSVENPVILPTSELPHWPTSTVEGGRAHFYEGYPMPMIGLPIRVMRRLGAEILIVTNAAGAVNTGFEPGDLMLIIDHINLVGMTGLSPLRGPNLDAFGPRFPDMSQVYDRKLMQIARKVAEENGIPLREGVYICLAGPAFETPADLRFLHGIGVDAVGMSTVPEATTAKHSGLRVLGISGISNKANLDGETVTTHEEVLAAGKAIVPKLSALLTGVLQQL